MNSTAQFSVIAALDLTSIKAILMNKESGEGWSQDRADAAEFEYRRFLYLAKRYPHEPTAPLCDVDIFWHHHILDTVKYAADCDQVFGYFLHHVPDNGLRGEADATLHHQNDERMHELYAAAFGEACGLPHNDTGAAATAAWCQLGIAAQPQEKASLRDAAAVISTIKAKTAWCQLQTTGTPQQAVTTQTAWCQLQTNAKPQQPPAMQTAWCQLQTTAKPQQAAATQTAWCQLQTTAKPRHAAAAQTAWCQLQSPAQSATCVGQMQSDRRTPAMAVPTAWCQLLTPPPMQASAQNDSVYSACA